uniref:Retroviral polymerase SH3-like domain-containing protein n=1 Tax=Peronospora matthiolae TaxID=2874970 RepID=A0AAV1TG48_9STRA
MSKAYRVYDIKAVKVVISRDVSFDESTFGLPLLITDEDADDLDFELLDLNDEEPRLMEYKQTGKRKNRLSDEDTASPRPRAVRQRPGLEKSSAPESNSSRQEEDEETKDSDESTPPVFCCASANAVETAADLSEPSTFEAAVSGLDQVYWSSYSCRARVNATSQCVLCRQASQRTTRHWHKMGVQDQAQGGWVNREVLGTTCGQGL